MMNDIGDCRLVISRLNVSTGMFCALLIPSLGIAFACGAAPVVGLHRSDAGASLRFQDAMEAVQMMKERAAKSAKSEHKNISS